MILQLQRRLKCSGHDLAVAGQSAVVAFGMAWLVGGGVHIRQMNHEARQRAERDANLAERQRQLDGEEQRTTRQEDALHRAETNVAVCADETHISAVASTEPHCRNNSMKKHNGLFFSWISTVSTASCITAYALFLYSI